MAMQKTDKTLCCLLVDKEEIGSVGATGMASRFLENAVAELVALTEGESELKVRRALQKFIYNITTTLSKDKCQH